MSESIVLRQRPVGSSAGQQLVAPAVLGKRSRRTEECVDADALTGSGKHLTRARTEDAGVALDYSDLPKANPILIDELQEAEKQADADDADADFQPTAEESEVEEEYEEGHMEDDEVVDGELPAADPELLQELDAAAVDGDAEGDAEFQPAADESDVEEEYDEGPVLADDAERAYDEAQDEDFQPAGAESEVEEEYDEGAVVDDERPPFVDGELPEPDPELLQELQAAEKEGDVHAEKEADFQPAAYESEVEEEYDEGDVVDDERPPFEDDEEEEEEDEDDA